MWIWRWSNIAVCSLRVFICATGVGGRSREKKKNPDGQQVSVIFPTDVVTYCPGQLSSSSSSSSWWGRIACSWPRSHVHHGCHGTCPTLQSSQREVCKQRNIIEHSKTLTNMAKDYKKLLQAPKNIIRHSKTFSDGNNTNRGVCK